jgi:hypothetical protein
VPLYIVRWQNVSAALIQAQDEDDLLDTLDEMSSPAGCRWEEYTGPVHIEFDLPITFAERKPGRSLADLSITALPKAFFEGAGMWAMDISIPGTDTGANFMSAIAEFAFPNLEKALGSEEYPAEKKLKAAAVKDLDVYVQANWQHDQLRRSTDPAAQMALQLGTSKAWVESVQRRALAPQPGKKKASGKSRSRGGRPKGKK